jgi:hypothetical protein
MPIPTLTDADCDQVIQGRDLLFEGDPDYGIPPVFGEAFVKEIRVNDGLGHALAERQFLRMYGRVYRVAGYSCGSHHEGYRFVLKPTQEAPDGCST